MSASLPLTLVSGEELENLRERRRDHRHMRAVRNLDINGIETSCLQSRDSLLRLLTVEGSVHGTGGGEQWNPLKSLGRIILVSKAARKNAKTGPPVRILLAEIPRSRSA